MFFLLLQKDGIVKCLPALPDSKICSIPGERHFRITDEKVLHYIDKFPEDSKKVG